MLGIVWKGKGHETCVIMMPLCIHPAPISSIFYIALAPNSQCFHLKKTYPRTGGGSEDIKNHQNYGIPRERIINLKKTRTEEVHKLMETWPG